MTKASEWALRVAAWRASGKSAAAFCENQEYSAKSLQWWSSRLRRRGLSTKAGETGVALARVVRSPDATAVARSASIVVELGDARVEVPSGVDQAALAVVLAVLRGTQAAGRR